MDIDQVSSSRHSPDTSDFAFEDDGEPDVVFRQDEEFELKRQAVITTYEQVWREFYTWEQEHCSRVLRSLAPEPLEPATSDFGLDADPNEMQVDSEDMDTENSGASFTVWTWDASGHASKEIVHAQPPKATGGDRHAMGTDPETFEEHRTYESCTPYNGYIFLDHNTSRKTCRFIKYGDSPLFNSRAYMQSFQMIKWQEPWRDPDRK